MAAEDNEQAYGDELQQLTFDLCHVAGVATKVVGRPAPVYYAKRAALLARYYEGGRREEGLPADSRFPQTAPRGEGTGRPP